MKKIFKLIKKIKQNRKIKKQISKDKRFIY